MTALYAVRLTGDGENSVRIATVQLRWVDPESNRPDEVEHDVRTSDFEARFRSTAPTFQLGALVAAAAERMRGSEFGREYDLDDVLEAADTAAGNLPQTEDMRAFLDLLEAAARLER